MYPFLTTSAFEPVRSITSFILGLSPLLPPPPPLHVREDPPTSTQDDYPTLILNIALFFNSARQPVDVPINLAFHSLATLFPYLIVPTRFEQATDPILPPPYLPLFVMS